MPRSETLPHGAEARESLLFISNCYEENGGKAVPFTSEKVF